MTRYITNAKVVHERGIIWDGAIVVTDDRIAAYGKRAEVEIPEGAEVIDAGGAYVGPGFVDIHLHGGGGYQSSTNPVEMAEYFLSHGETSILCAPNSFATRERDEGAEIIKTVREAMKTAKSIKGLYMEGPYCNPKYGAGGKFNKWGNRPVDPDDVKAIVDAGGRDVKVWMIAPELMPLGLKTFLEYAREVNPDVAFAVGHSEALPSEIRSLGRYRPKIQTHAMNATGRVNEKGKGLRYFGPDEYCFKENDVYCELISDSLGIHVNSELQELLIHAKGVHRVMLISDSTQHNDAVVPEQYAGIDDINFNKLGHLAGSKLTMDKACRNVMSHTRVGITEAFLMASTNPAKAVGLYNEVGSITVGKKADLVFVDDTFNVKRVMLEGELVERINL